MAASHAISEIHFMELSLNLVSESNVMLPQQYENQSLTFCSVYSNSTEKFLFGTEVIKCLLLKGPDGQ